MRTSASLRVRGLEGRQDTEDGIATAMLQYAAVFQAGHGKAATPAWLTVGSCSMSVLVSNNDAKQTQQAILQRQPHACMHGWLQQMPSSAPQFTARHAGFCGGVTQVYRTPRSITACSGHTVACKPGHVLHAALQQSTWHRNAAPGLANIDLACLACGTAAHAPAAASRGLK